MSAIAPTATIVTPNGTHSLFTVKSTLPATVVTDVLSVTLPAGLPKDALPIGPANVFTLATDTYTLDADIAGCGTHDRSTGITTYTSGGTIAAGSFLVQVYALVGAG